MIKSTKHSVFLSWSLTAIVYNYPPKGMWIVVDIYRDAKRRGIYPPLLTDPEGDSCFSIYQIRWIKNTLLQFLLLKLSRNDAPFFSRFAKQWISKDIPSYGSQSKRAKIAIHWFGKYLCMLTTENQHIGNFYSTFVYRSEDLHPKV